MLVVYRDQIDWLLVQAGEFDDGTRKVLTHMRGKDIDLSPNIAAEYRYKAANMRAIMEAYERLNAKRT
jgi:hypothetical protein